MTAAPEAPRVAILGAGPAGLSAALWCESLGLRATVLDARATPGGQLLDIPVAIENHPGIARVEGAELARTLHHQCLDAGVELRGEHPCALDPIALTVRCDARHFSLQPAAVVLATGVRRRRLDVPGEEPLRGRGVHYNVGASPERFAGLRVLVVGGGDDAFEHARLLAPHAREVALAHRSDRFVARPALMAPVGALPNVTLRPFTRVEAIEGADRVESVRLATPRGAEAQRFDAVFVCVGPQPNGAGFHVATDARGYVAVDRLHRTSRSGVYAVGDVASPEAPTVATAIGQGASVAKVISATLAGHASSFALTPERAADRLSVRGISLPARIGVYPRERRRLQTLAFDVSFDVDAGAAAPTDALRCTIDYAAVADAIQELLASQHFNLIETVADRVARTLMARFSSRRVRVKVTKPGVPQQHASASIEVERRRDVEA